MLIKNPADFLKDLKNSPENFFVIHYSSRGLSLEITSIAITNYKTEKTNSFSTDAIAAELHIKKEDVKACFDKIELEMLHQFYKFIRKHKNKFWVHWNMRNQAYGFEHLEQRYRALGGKNAPEITYGRRLNLNDMLKNKYGSDYAKDRRMPSLMEMNGGIHRDFLLGEEEVKAFEMEEFACIHHSTLVKVGFFCDVMEKMISGTLKTSSGGFRNWFNKFLESRKKKVLDILGSLAGIISLLYIVYIIVTRLK